MAKKRPRSKRPRPNASATKANDPPRTLAPGRVEIVDAGRGFAVAMMIAYHCCFDLTWFGWSSWRMLDDAGWIAWRTTIVTSFLLLVGVSIALRADRERQTGRKHWFERAFVVRWSQIAAGAALVTAGSLAFFPARFIYFGVLHFVALALWLCRRAPSAPRSSLAIAVITIVAGVSISHPAFDPKTIDWLGFAREKPLTEDYVPVFPWIGAVLAGCALGRFWTDRACALWSPVSTGWHATPAWLRRALATLGRWSLTTYLVHQPLLMGAMALVKRLA